MIVEKKEKNSFLWFAVLGLIFISVVLVALSPKIEKLLNPEKTEKPNVVIPEDLLPAPPYEEVEVPRVFDIELDENGNIVLDDIGRPVLKEYNTEGGDTEGSKIEYVGNAIEAAGTDVKGFVIKETDKNGEEQKYLVLAGKGELNTDLLNAEELGYLNSYTKIYISEGVETIPTNAFSNFGNLETITIPTTVKTIGSGAFRNNDKLKNIMYMQVSTIENINRQAFYNCSTLEEIYIPKSVTSIGSQAYGSTKNVTKITVEEGNPVYKSDGNCLIKDNTAEGNGYSLIQGCKTSVIPNYVTSLGQYCFTESSITEISIPKSVTSIGRNAFGYSSLENITFAENSNLTSIGRYAFSGSNIKKITIPNSVTTIGSGTFAYCYSLKRVEFEEQTQGTSNLIEYDGWVFEECFSLENIYIPSNLTDLDFYDNYIYTPSIKELAVAAGNTEFRVDVVNGNKYLMQGETLLKVCKGIKNLHIPKSVTYIEPEALYTAYDLETITVEDGHEQFYVQDNCLLTKGGSKTYLLRVAESDFTIPEEEIFMDYEAFAFSAIKAINIPTNLLWYDNRWYSNPFEGCNLLEKIEVEEGHSNFSSEGNCLLTKDGTNLLAGCKTSVIPNSVKKLNSVSFFCVEFETIVIPDGVEEIRDSFYFCTKLKTIKIPSSVTKVSGCFADCYSLQTVIYPKSLSSISENMFLNCYNLQAVYCEHTSKEELNNTISSGISDRIIYYYSETAPTSEGQFWHYAEDGKTPVIWPAYTTK